MDNCLEEFCKQLETSFDPDSIFPAKKPTAGWLTRLFAVKKTANHPGKRNTVNEGLKTDRLLSRENSKDFTLPANC